MSHDDSTSAARGGAGLDEHALRYPDAWWSGYAAGHTDGTAEAQLLIMAARLAAHAATLADAVARIEATYEHGAAEHAAHVRSVTRGPGRGTGTATGDLTAAGQDGHPYRVHTDAELDELNARRSSPEQAEGRAAA